MIKSPFRFYSSYTSHFSDWHHTPRHWVRAVKSNCFQDSTASLFITFFLRNAHLKGPIKCNHPVATYTAWDKYFDVFLAQTSLKKLSKCMQRQFDQSENSDFLPWCNSLETPMVVKVTDAKETRNIYIYFLLVALETEHQIVFLPIFPVCSFQKMSKLHKIRWNWSSIKNSSGTERKYSQIHNENKFDIS